MVSKKPAIDFLDVAPGVGGVALLVIAPQFGDKKPIAQAAGVALLLYGAIRILGKIADAGGLGSMLGQGLIEGIFGKKTTSPEEVPGGVPTQIGGIQVPEEKLKAVSPVAAKIIDPPFGGETSRGFLSQDYPVTIEIHNLTSAPQTAIVDLKITHYRNFFDAKNTDYAANVGSYDLEAGQLVRVVHQVDAGYFDLALFEYTIANASADLYVNNVLVSSTTYTVK